MANNSTTTSGLSNQFQTFFNKKLLDYAVQALKLDQFAVKASLPKNAGAKSVRFFRYGEPNTTNVYALTEGTAISSSNYRTLELENVDATLSQYGEVIGVTDLMSATDLLQTLKQASMTAGQDAALKCDTVARDELVNSGDSDESDSRTKRYSGSSNSTWANLAADTGATANFTAVDLLDACTNLKVNRAPMIGGSYVAIMPPQVSRDLMNDDDWLEAHKYSDVKGLYKGEAGSIHGVRIVEASNPYREDASGAKGTHAADGEIYSTIITGSDSYGVPALEGDSPMSPRIVIADTPDKSDPLNQLTTLGFKVFYTAKTLNSNWFVVHRSKSAYA
tara:strand:- start:2007 stop:3008 length:1002 start_codon:yes stop_codon:yes gene_type:complete